MTVVIPNSPHSMNPCWRVKPIAASAHPCTIPADTIELLRTVAEREGARLISSPSETTSRGAATIFAAAERARYLTPQLHAEMVSELRWPGDPCPDTGIDVRSLELDPGDFAVIDILKRPDVMACLAQWNGEPPWVRTPASE